MADSKGFFNGNSSGTNTMAATAFQSLRLERTEMDLTREHTSTSVSHSDIKLSLNQRLDYYFTSLLDGNGSHTYSDNEILEIRDLIQSLDSNGILATAPRLYIVLRRAGLLNWNLFREFISNNLSDTGFPFSESNLPRSMDLLQRRTFIQTQYCILTKESTGGRCEKGEHCQFADQFQNPFQRVSLLGSGGYAQVEKVTSKITGLQYARKRLDRRAFGNMRENIRQFENEIKTIKKLHHQHIVEIIGSYTDPCYAAIIMAPVADCDLFAYLKEATTSPDKRSFITTFFGCITTALQYLHRERIRHKDIKPSNILVKDGTVLLTDFGLARDCNDTRSTSEGPTALSQRYCSPEVADKAPRSYSSDIWSLGCVFLEMLTVIRGVALTELLEFFRERGTGTAPYWSNEEAISGWIQYLDGKIPREEFDGGPSHWISQLLRYDRTLRPSAATVAFQIANHASPDGRTGKFCGICCRLEHTILGLNTTESVVEVLPTVEISSQAQIEREGLFVSPAREDELRDLTQNHLPPYLSPQPTVTPNETPPMIAPNVQYSQHRYFVLRSSCEVDIETSNAHGVWVSSPHVNTMLNNAYLKRIGQIFLIFSVTKSRKFCGVAEMTSAVDWDNTDEYWEEDKWKGRFTVSWLSSEEIGFDEVSHLKKIAGKDLSITWGHDGEIQASSGEEIMRRFGLPLATVTR